MAIEQQEQEALGWAISIADNKEWAEAAKAANNTTAFNQYNSAAEAARQKLRSLGYAWIADALSADGATGTQARLYVQSLRSHLDKYAPGSTPALTLQAGLNSVPTTSSSSDVAGIVSNAFGSLTAGLGQVSAGARTEATNWLPIVQAAVKIILPAALIWGAVKVFRIKLTT